jgi:hypothetical protein
MYINPSFANIQPEKWKVVSNDTCQMIGFGTKAGMSFDQPRNCVVYQYCNGTLTATGYSPSGKSTPCSMKVENLLAAIDMAARFDAAVGGATTLVSENFQTLRDFSSASDFSNVEEGYIPRALLRAKTIATRSYLENHPKDEIGAITGEKSPTAQAGLPPLVRGTKEQDKDYGERLWFKDGHDAIAFQHDPATNTWSALRIADDELVADRASTLGEALLLSHRKCPYILENLVTPGKEADFQRFMATQYVELRARRAGEKIDPAQEAHSLIPYLTKMARTPPPAHFGTPSARVLQC